MKKSYEYVCDYLNEGENYQVYKGNITGEFYKTKEEKAQLVEENELNSIETAYNLKKHNKNKIKKSKATKLKNRVLIALLAAGLIASSVSEFKKTHPLETTIIFEDQSHYQNMEYFKYSIDKNKTISIEDKEELLKYIEVLAKEDINDLRVLGIGSRLSDYNFSKVDVNSEDIIDTINTILNLKDHGFVANELYAFVNKTESKYKDVSALFSLEKDLVGRLLTGESIDKIMKDKLGFRVDIGNLSETDKIIIEFTGENIAREIINDKIHTVSMKNNIFSDYVVVNCANKFDIYYYQDVEGNLYSCTKDVYKEKLANFIDDYADTKDYTNKNYRVLVYLYANAVMTSAEGMTADELLFNGLDSGSHLENNVIDRDSLYSFFTTGELKNAPYVLFSGLAKCGNVELLQEVNLCLKEELREGNITQEDYDKFIDISILELNVKGSDEIEKFIEANMKDVSIDDYELHLTKRVDI